jgi:hypothetical protein
MQDDTRFSPEVSWGKQPSLEPCGEERCEAEAIGDAWDASFTSATTAQLPTGTEKWPPTHGHDDEEEDQGDPGRCPRAQRELPHIPQEMLCADIATFHGYVRTLGIGAEEAKRFSRVRYRFQTRSFIERRRRAQGDTDRTLRRKQEHLQSLLRTAHTRVLETVRAHLHGTVPPEDMSAFVLDLLSANAVPSSELSSSSADEAFA